MDEIFKAIGTGSGIAGAILVFHLWKLAPELRAIWRAIDRGNRVRLLGIISAVHVAPGVKDEAAVLVKEIEDEEKRGVSREIIPP